jgi:hypothetical protein
MVRELSPVSCGLLALALLGSNCGGNPAGPSKSTNDRLPPVISGLSASPALGVLGVTTFALSADAVAQPGTTLAYAWDFGDGTRATGATVAKTYNRAASFDVIVSVTALRTDGTFAGSATSRLTVSVVLLTGTWSDEHLLGRTQLHLTQNGPRLTGIYTRDSFLPILGPSLKWVITADAPGHVDATGAFVVPTGPTPAGALYGELRSRTSASYGYGTETSGNTLTKTSDTP